MDKHAIRSRALRHGFTLRPQGDGSEDLNDYVYSFAAEVFEAGKRAVAAERHEQQAAGTHPAPCARHCEANAFQIEIRGLTAAHASAWEAGKKLAQQALKAERERDALRLVCGEAYQMAGALDAPTKALDNLLAASTGAPLPHGTFLPVEAQEREPVAWQERQAVRAVGGVVTEWTSWYECKDRSEGSLLSDTSSGIPYEWRPLYAHPVPARELTDAIIGQIYIKAAAHIEHATQREIAFARAIERHLRGDAP